MSQLQAATTPDTGHVRRSDVLYEELKEDIAGLRIAPESRLYEVEVAERYGASRTPARESLMRLVKEGLVDKNGRAYVVRTFSVADVIHIYALREALECLSVRLAIDNADDADIEELGGILALMDKASDSHDLNGYLKLDRNFHICIGRISENPFLQAELMEMGDKVAIIQAQWRKRVAKLPNLHKSHERLFDAISRRDKTIAEAEMRYHLHEFICSMRMGD